MSLLALSLARLTFLNCQEKQKVGNILESEEALASMSLSDISKIISRPLSYKIEWDGKQNLEEAQKEYFWCQRLGIDWISIDQDYYPDLLKELSNPPFLLFYRGNLSALKGNAVSVVGTRRITPGARKATFEFAKQACLDGMNIVSGLAYGVDSFAHKGAISAFNEGKENCGRTIAVLPCSIDEISPKSNVKLAENIILSGGLLISEYAPGIGMATWHYVQRNRIIAGLSKSTVVAQAPDGSGALITADFALESGRDVMFLESCFDQQAEKINSIVKQDLDTRYARNQVSKYKVENTVKKYLEEGAPVIKDFNDYKRCLIELPGTRMQGINESLIYQPSLFEDF